MKNNRFVFSVIFLMSLPAFGMNNKRLVRCYSWHAGCTLQQENERLKQGASIVDKNKFLKQSISDFREMPCFVQPEDTLDSEDVEMIMYQRKWFHKEAAHTPPGIHTLLLAENALSSDDGCSTDEDSE